MLVLCLLVSVCTSAGAPVFAQEAAPDTVLFTETFDDYPDGTKQLTAENSKWDSMSGMGGETADFEVAVDPKDSLNKVGKIWKKGGVTTKVVKSIKVPFDKPIVFSGRIYMPAKGSSAVASKKSLSIKTGAVSGNNKYVFYTRPDGQLRVGGSGSAIEKMQESEWVTFHIVLEPNEADMTKCPIRSFVSGGLTDSNSSSNPPYVTQTLATTLDASKFKNMITDFYLTFDDSSNTEDAEIYVDDLMVWQAESFTMAPVKATNVTINEEVEIRFNHAADLTSFKPTDAVVSVEGGAPVNAQVTYDERKPDRFTLSFPNGLSADTNYVVTLPDTAKDVLGNSLTTAARFSTGEGGAPVYDPITNIAISHDAPIEQEVDKLETITFTAVTTPATNVDYNKIEWLVGDEVKLTGRTFAYTPSGAAGDEVVITARYSENTGCFRQQNSYFDCAEADSGNGYFAASGKADSVAGLLRGCHAARMVHAAGRDESSGKVDVERPERCDS